MPRLACVVLSYRTPPTLVAAVRSIIEQRGHDVETIVVNSGGGETECVLRRAGIDVRVLSVSQRWYVGAARNAGIAATSSPFVAFLAADCLAEPGWVAGRLRAHEAGALAVASAVTNAYPDNPFAWTSYLDIYRRRMPTLNPQPLLYGMSYARTLFDRYGVFRSDLRTGEDTEFNARFAHDLAAIWAPDVRTAHRGPTQFTELLRDQHLRGRRAGRYYASVEGDSHWRQAAASSWHAWRTSAALAWRLRHDCAHPGALLASVAVQPFAIASRVSGITCWRRELMDQS